MSIQLLRNIRVSPITFNFMSVHMIADLKPQILPLSFHNNCKISTGSLSQSMIYRNPLCDYTNLTL